MTQITELQFKMSHQETKTSTQEILISKQSLEITTLKESIQTQNYKATNSDTNLNQTMIPPSFENAEIRRLQGSLKLDMNSLKLDLNNLKVEVSNLNVRTSEVERKQAEIQTKA